jgi:malonyl-CoA O-methyltransferase
VQLDSEYLPATGSATHDLVLLHGWGSDREIWRPLLTRLRPWANVSLLDLPGCAPACDVAYDPQLDTTLAAVLDRAPAEAVYIGWSLGGQLAVELAARYPERVAGVVTICSNPCFIASGAWPGMDAADFREFRAAYTDSPESALKRFDSLQSAGSGQRRLLLRQLQGLRRGACGPHLAAGLDWLEQLDQRAQLPQLVQPQLHILGARDGLVPNTLRVSLQHLLASQPLASIVMLDEACHLAPLESPAALAACLQDQLADLGGLSPAPAPENALAKADVADSFSRSARLYDSVAKLQRDVGTKLLTRLDQLSARPATILDLGCGTGYFSTALTSRFPQAHYIGLDLARGMVEFARESFPRAGTWVVGDAEALPLASGSVDLVFSSLAIQWCYRPQHLFAELARVLRPGGRCVFTSLAPDTLQELRSAWAAVDAHQHVNTFLPPTELIAAARGVPGVELDLSGELFRMEYQRVRDLLAELKTLGAHNMNRERPAGLTGRRALQGMLEAYEDWREDGALPATYDVIFGVLEKT